MPDEQPGFFRRAGERLGDFFGNVGRVAGGIFDTLAGGPEARYEGYRERTQAELAMEQARKAREETRRLEAERRSRENLDLALGQVLGVPSDEASAYADIIRGGYAGDFRSITGARGEMQTQGFRSTVADPSLADELRLAALEALAPTAAVNARLADELGVGTGRPRQPPSGYEWAEDGTLRPIPGGPADPAQRARLSPGLAGTANERNIDDLIARGVSERTAIGLVYKTITNPSTARVQVYRDLIRSGYYSPEEAEQITDEAIRYFYGDAGDALFVPPLDAADAGLPPELPPGSRLIGHTASGAPVYETPDGRRLVAE